MQLVNISPCWYLLCMVWMYANLCWIIFCIGLLLNFLFYFSCLRGFCILFEFEIMVCSVIRTMPLIFNRVILRCRPRKVQESYCIPVIQAADSRLSVFDGSISHPIRDCSLLSLSTWNPRIQSGLISGHMRCGVILRMFGEWVLSPPHKLYRICCLHHFALDSNSACSFLVCHWFSVGLYVKFRLLIHVRHWYLCAVG